MASPSSSPHTGEVAKMRPVLAALVVLTPKVKAVWVMATSRQPTPPSGGDPSSAACWQDPGSAAGPKHQDTAHGEADGHEQERPYGFGGVLGGGEVRAPGDGGQHQRGFRQPPGVALTFCHGSRFYAPISAEAIGSSVGTSEKGPAGGTYRTSSASRRRQGDAPRSSARLGRGPRRVHQGGLRACAEPARFVEGMSPTACATAYLPRCARSPSVEDRTVRMVRVIPKWGRLLWRCCIRRPPVPRELHARGVRLASPKIAQHV
jgi:hypothetical protein